MKLRLLSLLSLNLMVGTTAFSKGFSHLEMFLNDRCLGPFVDGRDVDVTGLQRLPRVDEADFLDGEEGAAWASPTESPIANPVLVAVTAGELIGCRVIFNGADRSDFDQIMANLFPVSGAFEEVEEEALDEDGVTSRLFVNQLDPNRWVIVIAVGFFGLKSLTIIVSSLDGFEESS